ncbi:MAG: tetratricopeptide repeat protein [Bacteroidales bacterium]|nr:tetratricopeptide repeat protein [Bacteroidales bacterium]
MRSKKHITLVIFFLGMQLNTFSQINIRSWLIQGQQNLMNEKYVDAIQQFTKVINYEPLSQEAYFLRGIAKYNLNDILGARQDFESTIELNPFYSHAYLYKGICEDQIGNYHQALNYFWQAQNLSPYNAYIFLNKGITYLHLHQFEKAIEQLDSCILLKSNIPESFLNRAMALEEIELDSLALLDLQYALKINPFLTQAYLRTALIKLEQENFEEALNNIEKAQKIDKEFPLSYFYKAHILTQQKAFDEALQNYNIVLELDPKNALVLYNRALVFQELKEEQKALDDLDQAIVYNPSNILIYYARALINYQNNHLQSALKDLQKTIDLYPNYSNAYRLRAEIYRQTGESTKANTDLLVYQNLIGKKDEIYNQDSIYLEHLVDFGADFIAVDRVKEQQVQFKTPSYDLKDDYLVFFRMPNYREKVYDEIQQFKFQDRTFEMVFYYSSNYINADSLIQYYKTLEPSYYKDFALGTCYGILYDYNQANELLSRCIEAQPNFYYAYLNRAYFNAKLSENIQNIETYNYQTIGIDNLLNTSNQQSLIDLSKTEASIINDLSEAVKNTSHCMVYYNFANALAINGQDVEAIRWYNKSIQKASDFPEVYFNKALIELKLQNQASACYNLSIAGQLGIEEAFPIIKKFCH